MLEREDDCWEQFTKLQFNIGFRQGFWQSKLELYRSDDEEVKEFMKEFCCERYGEDYWEEIQAYIARYPYLAKDKLYKIIVSESELLYGQEGCYE